MTIKVDYAVLESSNQQMQAISKTLEEKLDTLRSMLTKLTGTARTGLPTSSTRRSGTRRSGTSTGS